MLVKDLIRKFEACDPESDVKLWDRVNGKHIDIQQVDIDMGSVDLVFIQKKQ